MPVRSMTLTTVPVSVVNNAQFQMPVRSMTLTTGYPFGCVDGVVSDACQINDFDHRIESVDRRFSVSDACQINDFDHGNS